MRKAITMQQVYGTEEGFGENPWLGKIRELINKEVEELSQSFLGQCEYLFEMHGGNAAPASSRHHSNVLWGGWEHFYYHLRESLELNQKYGEPYPVESIIKCSLGHDLSRLLEAPYPADLLKSGPRKGEMSLKDIWVYDKTPRAYEGHEDSSLHIAQQFFDYDREERNAIRYHMGPYSRDHDIHLDWKMEVMSELCKIIHIADLIASQICETVWYVDPHHKEEEIEQTAKKEDAPDSEKKRKYTLMEG